VQFKAEIVDHAGFRIVRLAGRLQCEHTDELIRLCEASTPALRLDLTDLVSADPSGLETLLLIQQRGAQLKGASPYIVLQLDGAGPQPGRASRTSRGRLRHPTFEPGNRRLNKEIT
jgi:hypothetical protein